MSSVRGAGAGIGLCRPLAHARARCGRRWRRATFLLETITMSSPRQRRHAPLITMGGVGLVRRLQQLLDSLQRIRLARRLVRAPTGDAQET